jgi:hypothetical protein
MVQIHMNFSYIFGCPETILTSTEFINKIKYMKLVHSMNMITSYPPQAT